MVLPIRLTRRETLAHSLKIAGAGAVAVTATRMNALRALAQGSTAAGGTLAGLGLPQLDITVTDSGYEGLSDTLDAGLYLVNLTNNASGLGFIEFMQLPEGMSVSDLVSMLAGGAATPAAGEMEASPEAAGGEDQGPPAWYYTTYLAGGAGIGPSGSATFVINLLPGNYVVWAEDPSAPQTPVSLTVTGTGATPTAAVTPQANVLIQEQATDNGFAFILGNQVGSGAQVIEIDNISDQPHFVEFSHLPDGTTREDVQALIDSFSSGTPAAGGLSENDLQPFYFVGTQSASTTQWHEISFDPGTYLIACWVGDIKRGGIPHAVEGMYDVFTVPGVSATPTS